MVPPAKRILIAPLDWGLGHTTRCVPIIRALQGLGHTVLFAGNERQRAFILKTFPALQTHHLQGYDARYSRQALKLTLLWQVPRLAGVMGREHRWLSELAVRERIDGVISDNRYGLWHPRISSVIITHQPGIITGAGAAADALVRKVHCHLLKRFGDVWIPDLPEAPGLAGGLSHPPCPARNARYIGWLSQLSSAIPIPEQKSEQRIIILLSGPEPQRSLLADALWQQAVALPRQHFVFIEGAAGAARAKIPPHIHHIPLANAAALGPPLAGAALVVCRSGYSTLMDLAVTGGKAVLIPTPGQTEQEYLARSLSNQHVFYTAPQRGFCLADAIGQALRQEWSGLKKEEKTDLLLPVLKNWIEQLR